MVNVFFYQKVHYPVALVQNSDQKVHKGNVILKLDDVPNVVVYNFDKV